MPTLEKCPACAHAKWSGADCPHCPRLAAETERYVENQRIVAEEKQRQEERRVRNLSKRNASYKRSCVFCRKRLFHHQFLYCSRECQEKISERVVSYPMQKEYRSCSVCNKLLVDRKSVSVRFCGDELCKFLSKYVVFFNNQTYFPKLAFERYKEFVAKQYESIRTGV